MALILTDLGWECQGTATTGYCHWRFDYRAERAGKLCKDLKDGLLNCPQIAALAPSDDGINHPDSYALVQFSEGSRVISVSLKEKAQLAATFVFFRVD